MSPKLTFNSRLKLFETLNKGKTVKQICSDFGISRTLFYRLKKRYQSLGESGIKVRIPEPKRIKLTSEQRLKAIQNAIKYGKSINKIAKELGISRFTYYYWLKRYKQNPRLETLVDRYPTGYNHWHSTTESVKKLILELILINPSYSCKKIVEICKKQSIPIGHHGVQNILEKYNLSTHEKRRAWVYTQ